MHSSPSQKAIDISVSRASTLYNPAVPPESDLPRSSAIDFSMRCCIHPLALDFLDLWRRHGGPAGHAQWAIHHQSPRNRVAPGQAAEYHEFVGLCSPWSAAMNLEHQITNSFDHEHHNTAFLNNNGNNSKNYSGNCPSQCINSANVSNCPQGTPYYDPPFPGHSPCSPNTLCYPLYHTCQARLEREDVCRWISHPSRTQFRPLTWPGMLTWPRRPTSPQSLT